MALIYPSIDEVELLATPLNNGERRILNLLAKNLDDRWHIFVQPHLLNQHPDFVLVSAHHGVTIIEVKDWVSGGHRSTSPGLQVRSSDGAWVRTHQDPIGQAHRYRTVVADRFVTPPSSDALFGSVRAVVALPQWATSDAVDVFRSGTFIRQRDAEFIAVAGSEVFTDESALRRLVHGGKQGTGLSKAVVERLLARLVEPEATADQRRPLRLSQRAKDIESNPSNAIIRRIKGPAGSGKTLGLAARAARLASQDKSVLVLTYNITLAHYVQDLVRRHARQIGADHRLVDCIHIHGFCSDVVRSVGVNRQPMGGDADIYISEAQKLYERNVAGLPRYDAVLVDEGQDFQPDWWNFMRNHVRRNPTSEMVLTADATQDIYGRRSWTDETRMSGLGFSGDWSRLPGCYRLPVDLIPVAAEFATTYVTTDVDLPELPSDHSGIAAAPTARRWVNVMNASPADVASVVADEIQQILAMDAGPHEADTVFLTNVHPTGLEVSAELERRGLMVEHIFGATTQEKQTAKKRFWPGVAVLKGCTVHSFKGWESRAVVIVTDDDASSAADLAYVAISRVKGDPEHRSAFVTVVNTVEALAGFKERFERPISPAEVPQLGGQTTLELP